MTKVQLGQRMRKAELRVSQYVVGRGLDDLMKKFPKVLDDSAMSTRLGLVVWGLAEARAKYRSAGVGDSAGWNRERFDSLGTDDRYYRYGRGQKNFQLASTFAALLEDIMKFVLGRDL